MDRIEGGSKMKVIKRLFFALIAVVVILVVIGLLNLIHMIAA